MCSQRKTSQLTQRGKPPSPPAVTFPAVEKCKRFKSDNLKKNAFFPGDNSLHYGLRVCAVCAVCIISLSAFGSRLNKIYFNLEYIS